MSRFLTAAALLGSFAGRLPSAEAQPGTVDLAASGTDTESTVDGIQAAAVKGFAQVSGPLQYVHAKENFYVAGEPVYVDDYVQVTSEDAKRLVAFGRADIATDEEVAAAQSDAASKATKGK